MNTKTEIEVAGISCQTHGLYLVCPHCELLLEWNDLPEIIICPRCGENYASPIAF